MQSEQSPQPNELIYFVPEGMYLEAKTKSFATTSINSCVAIYAEDGKGTSLFAHILSADYGAGHINDFLEKVLPKYTKNRIYYRNPKSKQSTTDRLCNYLKGDTLALENYKGKSSKGKLPIEGFQEFKEILSNKKSCFIDCVIINGQYVDKKIQSGGKIQRSKKNYNNGLKLLTSPIYLNQSDLVEIGV